MGPVKDDLRSLLLRIVQTQSDAAAMTMLMQADLETLKLTLLAIAPQFSDNLGKALQANRERYARELERKKAELELLLAAVPTIVQ